MEGADAVIKYMDLLLKANNQKLSVIVAALTALMELLDKDGENILKKAAVMLGLHKSLIAILDKPSTYWEWDIELIPIPEEASCRESGSSDAVKSAGQASHSLVVDDQNTMHPLVHLLAMKCLNSISTLHQVNYSLFVDKSFIHSLLRFLAIHHPPPLLSTNHFYQFGPRFTSKLKDMVTSCKGRVAVKFGPGSNSNQEILGQFYFYEPQYFREANFQSSWPEIPLCSLRMELCSRVINVAEELVSENVAWGPCSQLKQEQETSEEKDSRKAKGKKKHKEEAQPKETWAEACVTQVLRGNFLWMQVGEDCLRAADRMAESLQARRSRLLKVKPNKGDSVAVQILTGKHWEVIRAKVVSVTAGIITVIDVDTGQLHKVSVHSAFSLPPDLSLAEIPPLATLVCLDGVLPKPLDVGVVEMAASSLSAVCRFSVPAAVMVRESGILNNLPDLIVCPEPEVSSQCLRLAANVLLRKRFKCDSLWLRIVMATLETMNKCVERTLKEKAAERSNKKTQGGKTRDSTGRDTVRVVSPRNPIQKTLEKTSASKQMSSSKDQAAASSSVGHKSGASPGSDKVGSDKAKRNPPGDSSRPSSPGVGEVKVSKARNKTLISSCLLLLINRLHMSREAKDFFYHLRGLESVIRAYLLHYKNHYVRTSSIQVLCNFVYTTQSMQPQKSIVTSSSAVGQQETAAALSSSSSSSSSSSLALSSSSLSLDQGGDDSSVPRVLSSVLKKKDQVVLGIGYEEDSEDDESTEDDEDYNRDDLLVSCFTGRRSSVEMSGTEAEKENGSEDGDLKRHYIRGSHVPFKADSQHELYQTTQLSAETMASIICGMLNNGREGRIYLGIEEDRTVKGERLSHNIRDEIRLGLDQIMMSRLVPSVLHSQFHVSFIPVVELTVREGQKHLIHYADLYVVEIFCSPVPKVLYCCNGGQCYYRVGSKNMFLQPQDIRHMIVIEEEGWHKQQITELRREVQALRQEYAQLRSQPT